MSFTIIVRSLHVWGLQLHVGSDLNPPKLLPQYAFMFGEGGIDNDDLDQPFEIQDGLFMSMVSCDLVQTKNLAADRRAIAERLEIVLGNDKVRVEKYDSGQYVS
jgi:hypothetical protein